MNRLTITITKILGACSSTPPVVIGDYFTVDNGDIRVPEGRFVCVWALQNILPLIPAKERKICEPHKEDWMWRVHHVQCPDPNGRVVFKIEKGVPANRANEAHGRTLPDGAKGRGAKSAVVTPVDSSPSSPIRRLRIAVDEVTGKCTSGLKPGDAFLLEGCRLTIPAGRPFCLYALQAVLPFVAAKQRRLEKGDWLERDDRFICPDPAGNVILRIEVME
jgi:uncharacterized repeat protein (TIGR04076 family)